MAWKGIIGKSFTAQTFDQYLHTLSWNQWRPSLIVIHNTASPTLAQRPNGLTHEHIVNLEKYYRDNQKWSAGPHLFIDDKQIWVFTPLTVSGVHSPSWNKLALGIEMLGDYNKEAFNTGRGLAVQVNTFNAAASICAILGIDPDTIRLHKEDPKTTHDCPGKNVDKSDLIDKVKAMMLMRHGGDH